MNSARGRAVVSEAAAAGADRAGCCGIRSVDGTGSTVGCNAAGGGAASCGTVICGCGVIGSGSFPSQCTNQKGTYAKIGVAPALHGRWYQPGGRPPSGADEGPPGCPFAPGSNRCDGALVGRTAAAAQDVDEVVLARAVACRVVASEERAAAEYTLASRPIASRHARVGWFVLRPARVETIILFTLACGPNLSCGSPQWLSAHPLTRTRPSAQDAVCGAGRDGSLSRCFARTCRHGECAQIATDAKVDVCGTLLR